MKQGPDERVRAAGTVIPPYVPYRTFRNFLHSISKKVPGRIDRSVMSSMSGTIQWQLMAALRYLEMVSTDGLPKEIFTRLVKSEGLERQKALREILSRCYDFLFKDFDLETATTGQIEKKFKQTGASGDTVRKCLAFFLAASREAGISLSPYIRPFRGVRSTAQRSTRAPARPALKEANSQADGAGDLGDRRVTGSLTQWQQLLLSKFPNFDSGWPDDLKIKWLEDFAKLVRIGQEERNKRKSR